MNHHHLSFRRIVCLSVLVSIGAAGCGGSDSSTPESVAQTKVSVTNVESTPDSVVESSTTTTAPDDTMRILVTVGVDSGADRVEAVKLNQQVELTIVNPKADDEFHLHGYDLGGGVTKAGEQKTFAFTATEAGEFEVESHVSETVLVVLKVS